MITKLLIAILLLGWLCSGIASAQAPDTLFISTTQVVHLRFGSELKYVNLGNKAIVAKIVDGSKDYVAVKAREPFDICTSMSCLESTGAMHTFLVAYLEHPSRLDIDTRITAASPEAPSPGEAASPFSFSSSPYADGGPSASSPIEFESLVSMKPELFHLGTSGYGIDILCENIFYKDDVLFLLISLKNGSAVSYGLSDPRFSVESKRRTKRGLQYEKAIFPKKAYGLGVVQPDATGKMVFTFDKVSLTRGQVFRIYFYERGGARNFVLTLGMNDINKAKRLDKIE